MASKGPMGFVRSNRRILSKGSLQAVTPVPAAPRPHRQPFDTSHLDTRQSPSVDRGLAFTGAGLFVVGTVGSAALARLGTESTGFFRERIANAGRTSEDGEHTIGRKWALTCANTVGARSGRVTTGMPG